MENSITVLGCGWLGLPFAQHMISQGWQVKGSTTSPHKLESLKKNGIKPYLVDLNNPDTITPDFLASDYLLINIPPSKSFRQVAPYQPLIERIQSSPVKRIIFVSSTSVYPLNNLSHDESATDEINDGINPLLDIERAFQNKLQNLAIVRFGGLIGGVRYPGRFFKADTIVKGGGTPVNLIHLDDCLLIIHSIIKQDRFNQIFNGVADTHPSKREFYSLAASLRNQPAPQFSSSEKDYKIISNEKTKAILQIQLHHPDLMAAIRDQSLWL